MWATKVGQFIGMIIVGIIGLIALAIFVIFLGFLLIGIVHVWSFVAALLGV
ncbi:hypothetical protein [Paucilactobacillus sp. N302-9]